MAQTFACYSTVRLKGTATANNDDGTTTPYSGPLTIWYMKPGATAPDSITATCTAGAWSTSVYCDTPGDWAYCVRKDGDPHGGTFDKSFRIRETAFPATVTP